MRQTCGNRCIKLGIVFFTCLAVFLQGCEKSTETASEPAGAKSANAETPRIKLVKSAVARPIEFVFIEGGAFVNTKSYLHGKDVTMTDFYLGKYEVTQQEWFDVMGSNPSKFSGANRPVEMVSWYDCVEYCNQRSIKEGLEPYYNIDKNTKDPENVSEHDDVKWVVTLNENSNGYRLPNEAEWEYVAGGGQLSKSYTFSGSDNEFEVAWYWRNSGDQYLDGNWHWTAIESNNGRTHPVGAMKPNELGLYDMSGNVREWCADWYLDVETQTGFYRSWRGGGWLGAEQACASSFRGKFEANGVGPDTGFRLCRNNLSPAETADVKAEPGPETKSESETDTDTKSETETETETKSESESETATATQAEAGE